MLNFEWTITEIFAENGENIEVKYLLKAQDESNIVETEGYHRFSEGAILKPFSEIKEENLIAWLDRDTTKDDVNSIKLNLENQLKALKSSKKVDFPWEADTFTIG